jgi:hypothetical protein
MTEVGPAIERAPVVVAGMHRSGTSLLGAFLSEAGVDLGPDALPRRPSNPCGFYEDGAFLAFQRRLLTELTRPGRGWPDWGLGTPARVDLKRVVSFEDEASRLVATRARPHLWGWKDPRTTLLLELWRRVAPEAWFVLVYRRPEEVVDSLLRLGEGPFASDPELCLEAWLQYNRALLGFVHATPQRVGLINIDALLLEPARVLEMLRDMGMPLGLERSGRELLDASRDTALIQPAPQLADLGIPPARTTEAVRLYEALEAAATLSEPPLIAASTLTIIVPCYNDGSIVERALRSAEPLGCRVVVVDDGSDDDESRRALEVLEQRGQEVLWRDHGGLGAARNAGFETAETLVVLPLDADDELFAEGVLSGLRLLRRRPDLGAVYGDVELHGAVLSQGPADPSLLASRNTISGCALIRRDLWADCGGYDEDLLGWEDWDLWLSAVDRGWVLERVPRPFFRYRREPDRLIGTVSRDAALTARYRRRVMARHPELFVRHLVHIPLRWRRDLIDALSAGPLGVSPANELLLGLTRARSLRERLTVAAVAVEWIARDTARRLRTARSRPKL